ncbi:MAG: DUF302 domain-containing protein [bacterium]
MGFLPGISLLRRFFPGFAVMAALVWIAASCAPQNIASQNSVAKPGLGEVRGPYLWIKTVSGDFEQVVEDIKGAVASRNFPVGAVRDYRESFSRRLKQIGGGSLPFEHYRIIEFCNVQLAIKSLSIDLRMGIFMPCRIVVFSPAGGEKITLMTVNPSFMAKALDNPALAPIAREVEAVIREIFQAVE